MTKAKEGGYTKFLLRVYFVLFLVPVHTKTYLIKASSFRFLVGQCEQQVLRRLVSLKELA